MGSSLKLLLSFAFVLYTSIINADSCVIYQDEDTCNAQAICEWDSDITQCVCNSVIPQDVVIIMDSSGSVLADGWTIQRNFVYSLISTAIPKSSPIGLVQFATETYLRYELSWDQSDRTNILSIVENLEYTRGWTYMKDAVEEAVYLFRNQSTNTQRRMVLITDGNPMPKEQTPCDLVPELDALGVDVLIIGVGASWSRERIDCLVKRDEDIIEVDSFTEDDFDRFRNDTDAFLCRDVSFVLTEIKPVIGDAFDPQNAFHPVPFVEFYNNVKDMELDLYNFRIDGVFTGNITAINDITYSPNGTTIWKYGTYLVLYDATTLDTGDITDSAYCYECICDLIAPDNMERVCNDSMYIACGPTSECQYDTNGPNGRLPNGRNEGWTTSNWRVTVFDDAVATERVIMNISHGMIADDAIQTKPEWIVIDDGFSYELTDKASCVPTHGECWKQSCTVYGTPGADPIDCDSICIDQNCQIGGDSNATCNVTTKLCDCKEFCYNVHSQPQCNCMVPPVNCTILLNTTTDGSTIPSGDASWGQPFPDWSGQYTLWYEVMWYTFQGGEHAIKRMKTPINQRGWTLYDMEWQYPSLYPQTVRAVVDFGDNPNTPNVTDPEVHYSDWTVCELRTLEPTMDPTPAPTLGLPPIDECNVTLRGGVSDRFLIIDIEWTEADLSATDTFGRDQFDDRYKLYFTQTAVYIPDTDDLFRTTQKVQNVTVYADEVPERYRPSDLVEDGLYEVRVSVVVHAVNQSGIDLDEGNPDFDRLMYEQSTICQWLTVSPTLSPSPSPTAAPSGGPTMDPTLQPTMAPTFAWWVLEDCVITMENKAGNLWTITWTESDPFISADGTLPSDRRIYIFLEDQENEMLILTETQFSPQRRTGNLVVDAINTDKAIILKAKQKTNGGDATLEFSPNLAICEIVTMAPTPSPTHDPTTKSPTKSPIPVPTTAPTKTPTAAPTYFMVIERCWVLIEDARWYWLTFRSPEFDYPSTPTRNDTLYVLSYGDNGSDLEELDAMKYDDTLNVTEVPRRYALSNISFDTEFRMTVRDRMGSFYGEWTLCEVLTKEPTPFPTVDPTAFPTPPPIEPPVGVFVYDDQNRLCAGDRRCACHVDFYNYSCSGEHHPDGTQIEDSWISFVSDGVQQPVLNVGRLPRNLDEEVIIDWKFVYLNRTEDDRFGQRIKPIAGSTTITGGDDLGRIVRAAFVPIANEQQIDEEKWYRFEIVSCRVRVRGNGDPVACGRIYPSWAYVVWIPESAFNAIIFGGGDVIPDWIFYLLLGGSVATVSVAYLIFVFFKNRNLKSNAMQQAQGQNRLLDGIGPQNG